VSRLARLSLCLLVAASFALSACGDDDGDPFPPINAQGLGAIERLSRAQYKAIERALTSGLRLDALARAGRLDATPKYNAAITRTLRACGELDGNDPLLRELFRSCEGESRVLVPIIQGRRCSTAESCARAFRLARHRLRYLARRYTRHNRAVRSTDLPAACKRTLSLTRADYAYIRRQRPIFKRIERATQSRSDVRLAAAIAAQRRLDDRSLADAQQTLRRLRAHCRPARKAKASKRS
jgi:hypothetical protein